MAGTAPTPPRPSTMVPFQRTLTTTAFKISGTTKTAIASKVTKTIEMTGTKKDAQDHQKISI